MFLSSISKRLLHYSNLNQHLKKYPPSLILYNNLMKHILWKNQNHKFQSIDDHPAVITIDYYLRNSNDIRGVIVNKTFYENGIIYRKNEIQPSIEHYNLNNLMYMKAYTDKNGKYNSNVNSIPSISLYHNNGNICCEYYFRNGKVHRDFNLPCIIQYNEINEIFCKVYYNNGEFKKRVFV